MSGTTRRCFFAIWPGSVLAAAMDEAARAARSACGGRAMRRDTLHVTLTFLGEILAGRVADARKVAGEVSIEPFDLTLDRLGYWKHNRILWAGGVSPRLTFLAEALGERLRAAGFVLDERPFQAHVTLLRDARCTKVPDLPQPIVWPVREFVLVESRLSREGSGYEIIGRWPLA